MKAVWSLAFFVVCAVLVVTYQAIKQELNIRTMEKVILLNTEEVRTMEDEILTAKTVMQKLSIQLEPLHKQRTLLIKKMEELLILKEKTEQNLNTCQQQKTEVEQQKSERSSTIDILKTQQHVEIQKLQENVQSLQKQILDRDIMICKHVDKQWEDGRKLCMDKMAARNL